MLELKNIGVVIKDGNEETEILKDISLTVNDGELVVLTGPNGGGKNNACKGDNGACIACFGQHIL